MTEQHERDDVTPALALKLAGGAAAMLAGCALLIVWIAPQSLHMPRLDLPALPKPALQISPRAEMDRFRADQQREMSSYGWVNRDRGVVRVPIEQAMRKVVKDGIPGWPAGAR